MKKSKLFISLTSVAALGASLTPIFTMTSCSKNCEDEYFKYKILNDNTYEVSAVKKTTDIMTIPAKINNRTVSTIGDQLFFNNHNIKAIQLPSTIKTIKYAAFQNCNALTSVNFETDGNASELETIEQHAFCGCSVLKNISLPSKLKTIGAFAFQFCLVLGESCIYIPKSVETIEIDAFNGCNKAIFLVASQNIPAKWHAKWNSSNRPYILGIDEGVATYVYTDPTNSVKYRFLPIGSDTCIVLDASNYGEVKGRLDIPTTVTATISSTEKTFKISALAPACFSVNNSTIRSVVLPSQAIELSEGCFKGLVTANIYSYRPISDAWIQSFEKAANGCKVYDRIEKTGTDVTNKVNYVVTLDGRAVVTSIAAGATDALTIPKQVESKPVVEVAPRAFAGNDNIKTVTFEQDTPASDVKIGAYAFANCHYLETAVLNHVTEIGLRAFYITTIKKEGSVIHNGVTKINATDNRLVTIGQEAFSKPNEGSYVEEGKTYYKLTQITELGIFANGNKIQNIGNFAFKSCSFASNLDIYFVSYMKRIGGSAFASAGFDANGKRIDVATTVKFHVSTALLDIIKNEFKWSITEHKTAGATDYWHEWKDEDTVKKTPAVAGSHIGWSKIIVA